MLILGNASDETEGQIAMHLSRRTFGRLAAGGLLSAGVTPVWAAADKYAPVPKGDSEFGSYTQSWFLDSFLEFADDIEMAADNGKRFALIWELEGCPYCRETHLVNFAVPQVRDYVEANFEIVQMDVKGAREVVDFDGEAMTESALARKSHVRFTPTIQFFPETLDEMSGKSGKVAEVARMPGYFRPFHFLTMFEYVREKAYESGDYRSFLKAKTASYEAEGKPIPSW